MPVERTARGTSLLDVLDRVLDKGIVIDAWIRASLGGVGIDLITVETRVIVASIATHLEKCDELVQASQLPDPERATTSPARLERLELARHRAAVVVKA